MKIGIISDSHDSCPSVSKAVKVFGAESVEYVLHAGDITRPATAEMFAGLDGAKFIAVFGNCDHDKDMLDNAVMGFGGTIYEESYKGVLGGKRIFMRHQPGDIESIASSGDFDLVIYGHTHARDVRRVGEALVINPGRARGGLIDKGHVAVLDLDDMSVKEISLK